MQRFWYNFLASQLLLAAICFGIAGAVIKHDLLTLPVLGALIGPVLWYTGQVLQLKKLTNGADKKEKLSAIIMFCGVFCILGNAINIFMEPLGFRPSLLIYVSPFVVIFALALMLFVAGGAVIATKWIRRSFLS